MTAREMLVGTFCVLLILSYMTVVAFLLARQFKARPEPLDGAVRAIAAEVERLKVASDEQAAAVKRVVNREAVARSRRNKRDPEEDPDDDDAPLFTGQGGERINRDDIPEPPKPWERQ